MKHLHVLGLICLLFTAPVLTAQDGYSVGDAASSFSLKNIDGKMVSPDDFPNAEGFIVVFTCNHCPFSKKYEDRIIELSNKFSDQGFPVIAINPNDASQYPEDSYENMKKRAKDKGFNFPYLLDDTQETAKAFGATRTPHTFVLERQGGNLIVRYIGAIDDNTDGTEIKTRYIEEAVSAIKAGNEVTTSFTKAIGCGIKWKKA